MWNVPRPGIEHMSPTLAEGLLTTGTPGKSASNVVLIQDSNLGIWDPLQKEERKFEKGKIFFPVHMMHIKMPFGSSFVVIQLLSHVRLFVTPWTAAHQAPLTFTISRSLLKFMSTESVMLSNHPILCHPLLFLPSIFPSIKVFSNDSALHIRWPNY